MEIIKRVLKQVSGSGGDYGRIYLPKRFIGTVVSIKVISKFNIKKWEKQKKKDDLEKNKGKIDLDNHLIKLKKLRDSHGTRK